MMIITGIYNVRVRIKILNKIITSWLISDHFQWSFWFININNIVHACYPISVTINLIYKKMLIDEELNLVKMWFLT